MPLTTRKCEKLVDGRWVPFVFDDLKRGDTFRLFESDDGSAVLVDGKAELYALSDAYQDKTGWAIDVYSPLPTPQVSERSVFFLKFDYGPKAGL